MKSDNRQFREPSFADRLETRDRLEVDSEYDNESYQEELEVLFENRPLFSQVREMAIDMKEGKKEREIAERAVRIVYSNSFGRGNRWYQVYIHQWCSFCKFIRKWKTCCRYRTAYFPSWAQVRWVLSISRTNR